MRQGAYRERTIPSGGYYFVEAQAVAEMLADGPLDVSEDQTFLGTELVINTNDIFVPGADDMPLDWADIESLYIAYCRGRGAVVEWLCEKTGERPWREEP